MAGIRHKARIAAMQALSIITTRNFITSVERDFALSTIFAEHFTQENEKEFLKELVNGVLTHRSAIDTKIHQHAPRFPVDKLASIDRCIIEIGIYEMLFSTTPSAIIINEAVEIAKEFGDEGTAKLVNGVLSSEMKVRN